MFNCNWEATKGQLFNAHERINNTGKVKKHKNRNKKKYTEQHN
jgi:hypothetical protein